MSDNEERAVNMWLWDILKNHFGHKVSIAIYGDVNSPSSVTLEDEDTGSIILDAGIYTLQERSDCDW